MRPRSETGGCGYLLRVPRRAFIDPVPDQRNFGVAQAAAERHLRRIESRDFSIQKALFGFSGYQRGSVLTASQCVLARVQGQVVHLPRPAVASRAFLRQQRSHVLLKRDFPGRLSQRHERRQQRGREPNATQQGRVPQPEFPIGLRNTMYSTPKSGYLEQSIVSLVKAARAADALIV